MKSSRPWATSCNTSSSYSRAAPTRGRQFLHRQRLLLSNPATGCRTFETDALCGSVLPFTGSWWPAVGRGRLRRKDQRPVISTLQASW